MLARFARLATRHSRPVLVSAVLFVVLAGAFGGGVAENLTAGGFVDPATESAQAEEILDDRFDTGVPNVVLVVTASPATWTPPLVADAGQALTEELAAEDHVTDVVSYWSEGGAPPCAATAATCPRHRPHPRRRRPGRGAHRGASAPLPAGRRRWSRWAATPRCSTTSARRSRRTCRGPR